MVSLSSLLAAAVLSFLVLSFFTAEGFEFVAEIKDFAEKSFTLLEKGLSVLLSSKVLVSAAAILGAIWVRLTLRVHLSALKRNAEAQEYNGQKTSFSESRLMRMMYACGKGNHELVRQISNSFFEWTVAREPSWFWRQCQQLKAELQMSADHNSISIHPKYWLSLYLCLLKLSYIYIYIYIFFIYPTLIDFSRELF